MLRPADSNRYGGYDGASMTRSTPGHRSILLTFPENSGKALIPDHPFVEVLFSDITESGEVLNVTELVRAPLPPAFNRK